MLAIFIRVYIYTGASGESRGLVHTVRLQNIMPNMYLASNDKIYTSVGFLRFLHHAFAFPGIKV